MRTLELPVTQGGSAYDAPASTPPPARPPGLRPFHRPPLALRALVGLVGAAATMSIVALMLSDRAPGALRVLFGDAVQRVSARLDASQRLPSTDQLPESDFIVHVGLWAVAAVLVGWTIWSWRGLVLGALTVFTVSVLVEAAQGTYSDTRAVEAGDVAANAVGVGLGAVVAGACYLVWSAFGWTFDRLRSG